MRGMLVLGPSCTLRVALVSLDCNLFRASICRFAMATPPASSDVAVEDGKDTLVLHVRRTNGDRFDITVPADGSVKDCMLAVAKETSIPVEQQRLVWRGRILAADNTLESYGTLATCCYPPASRCGLLTMCSSYAQACWPVTPCTSSRGLHDEPRQQPRHLRQRLRQPLLLRLQLRHLPPPTLGQPS